MIFYYRIAGKRDCADCSHQNCSAEGSLQGKIPENVSFRARNEVGGPIDLVQVLVDDNSKVSIARSSVHFL